MRLIVILVVLVHGLIHLFGTAKGHGWADVPQLKEPISTAMGSAWLAAAVLVVGGVLLALGARWWWAVGGFAVVVSQTVILTSWSDVKAGTLAAGLTTPQPRIMDTDDGITCRLRCMRPG